MESDESIDSEVDNQAMDWMLEFELNEDVIDWLIGISRVREVGISQIIEEILVAAMIQDQSIRQTNKVVIEFNIKE
ncbi:MAG: hypothetical protein ACRCXZ_01300 [Patescibacteria group bacterium]